MQQQSERRALMDKIRNLHQEGDLGFFDKEEEPETLPAWSIYTIAAAGTIATIAMIASAVFISIWLTKRLAQVQDRVKDIPLKGMTLEKPPEYSAPPAHREEPRSDSSAGSIILDDFSARLSALRRDLEEGAQAARDAHLLRNIDFDDDVTTESGVRDINAATDPPPSAPKDP